MHWSFLIEGVGMPLESKYKKRVRAIHCGRHHQRQHFPCRKGAPEFLALMAAALSDPEK